MANRIKVLKDIEDFTVHTLKLLENSNNFPKKYKYSINNRIISQSFELYDLAYDANKESGRNRLEYQAKAINMYDKMKMTLRVVKRHLDPSCSMVYWDKLIQNIKDQLERWYAYTSKTLNTNK